VLSITAGTPDLCLRPLGIGVAVRGRPGWAGRRGGGMLAAERGGLAGARQLRGAPGAVLQAAEDGPLKCGRPGIDISGRNCHAFCVGTVVPKSALGPGVLRKIS
jgi:hypothetical protein